MGRGGGGGEVKQNDIVVLGVGSLCDRLVVRRGKLLSSRHLRKANGAWLVESHALLTEAHKLGKNHG